MTLLLVRRPRESYVHPRAPDGVYLCTGAAGTLGILSLIFTRHAFRISVFILHIFFPFFHWLNINVVLEESLAEPIKKLNCFKRFSEGMSFVMLLL